MIPLMFEELIFLPKSVSFIAILMLIVASIVERRHGYISRMGVVLNVLLLWQIFYPEWNSLSEFLQYYLNIGTLLGIIAFFAYIPLTRFSLPGEFYSVAFLLYGSLTILIIIGYYFFNLLDYIARAIS